MTDGTFDVVVLGGGSGGYAAALRAAQLDLSVALIEKEKLGGTCLHKGCIPTKALLHAAEVADSTRDSAHFGVTATLDGIDMAALNAYKEGLVARLYKGLQGLVTAAKITYVAGEGRLVAPLTVEIVGDSEEASPRALSEERTGRAASAGSRVGERYVGRNLVLASGSYPRTPPGLAIDGERVLTSEQALQLDRVPASVIVIGGGVIGVEFASVWRSFGAEVSIVEMLPRLVPTEDEDCSKALERAFRKRGIGVHTGRGFEQLERTEKGVRLTIAGGQTLEAEIVLAAVGRGPVTADLGYEEQGLRMDRGFVPTDERLRTNLPNVYAVGDIVPGLQLAHRGFQQGIFIAEQIAGLNPAVIDENGIPRVTYSDPEIASMGLSEAKAKQHYGDARVASYTYNLAGNGKSQILRTAGFVKVVRVVDGPVVGVHMVGARVGELVGEAQLIYNWEAYPAEVAQLVHAHPTQSEAIGEAHLALAGKPLHAHT